MNIILNNKNREDIFVTIMILDKNVGQFLKSKPIISMLNKWQLILFSDGSLTQNLYSFTGNSIKTHIQNENSHILINTKKIRRIWLSDMEEKKLIFAQSSWHLKKDLIQKSEQNNKKPIGEILIKYKKDISKEIQEIYYGHSIYLNKYFQSQEPVWGRKCKLYYKKKLLVTIDEFFSPRLIYLF
uniref:Hypothetical chloroplast RF21 n=1 Tax=Gastroclonium compressum TaxID=1852973 RepID=A0A173FZV5_GASCM|nr:hypothetical chloroplast RF21 [Coeloseira compressa]ANH09566.1 hypothetical chloroplast RF21 [Coeloseira compressa]